MPTIADERLARAYRQQNITLRANTLRDALRLWPLLDPRRMDETFADWLATHGALIQRDRRRSAALAASYLKAARLASEVGGDGVIQLASELPAAQLVASMSTTARAGYYTALRGGQTPDQARATALVRTLGATGRLVLGGGRDTVRNSLKADSRGRGWQRVAGGGACSFCRMLAGRGAVYSAETADFAAHDHCGCTVAAVYSDTPIPVREYEPSARGRWSARATPDDRARMRKALTGL